MSDPAPTDRPLRYKRVLLKLSGEALMGQQTYGIDSDLLVDIAKHLKSVQELGVELAIVVGGGNIFRGVAGVKTGVDRVTGDHMGMLATVINALALMSALEAQGVDVRVQTAIEMREVAEPFIVRRAIRHLEVGRVVIFAAGTGHPFFSTDTAAALRAAQVKAEALLMAKNRVDGVYDADPNVHPDAHRFDELDYSRLMDLAVMDGAAAALARSQELPIHVFDFAQRDNIRRIVVGEQVGTVIRKNVTATPDSARLHDVMRDFLRQVEQISDELERSGDPDALAERQQLQEALPLLRAGHDRMGGAKE